MTQQWRILPTGQRQWRGSDGQWYTERSTMAVPPMPRQPLPPPIYRPPRRREPLLSGPGKAIVAVIVVALLAAGVGIGLIAHARAKNGQAATNTGVAPKRSGSAATAQAVELLTWFHDVKSDYAAAESAITDVATAALSTTTTTRLARACTELTTAMQSLQGDPPAPVAAVNTPYQAALTAYATGGSLCESGAIERTTNLLNQATADFTAAKSEFAQATAAIKVLDSTA